MTGVRRGQAASLRTGVGRMPRPASRRRRTGPVTVLSTVEYSPGTEPDRNTVMTVWVGPGAAVDGVATSTSAGRLGVLGSGGRLSVGGRRVEGPRVEGPRVEGPRVEGPGWGPRPLRLIR